MAGWEDEWPMVGGGAGEEHAEGHATARLIVRLRVAVTGGWGRGARSTVTLFWCSR